MKIITAPNPILFKKAEPVKKIDKKIKKLVKEMTETLISAKDPEGIGLAATQVGINLRIFIIKLEKKSPVKVFINPKIIQKSKKMKEDDKMMEGCLSIPKVWGPVKRYETVKVRFQDLDGKNHEETFTDLIANVIQHETDHLNGILFTGRILKQRGKMYQVEKGEKDKPSFKPIEL